MWGVSGSGGAIARVRSAQRFHPRLDRLVGAHQILEIYFADAVSAHLAAKPFTPEIGESGCFLVPVKGVQSRARRCNGSRGEFEIGCPDHQL